MCRQQVCKFSATLHRFSFCLESVNVSAEPFQRSYFTDRNQTIKKTHTQKNFNISENDVQFGAVLLNFIVAFIPRIMTDQPTEHPTDRQTNNKKCNFLTSQLFRHQFFFPSSSATSRLPWNWNDMLNWFKVCPFLFEWESQMPKFEWMARVLAYGHGIAKSSRRNWFFTWIELLNNAHSENVVIHRPVCTCVWDGQQREWAKSKKVEIETSIEHCWLYSFDCVAEIDAIKFNYISHKFRFENIRCQSGEAQREERQRGWTSSEKSELKKCKQWIINIVVAICDHNSLMNFISSPIVRCTLHCHTRCTIHNFDAVVAWWHVFCRTSHRKQ